MKSLFIAILSIASISLVSAHCGSCGVGDKAAKGDHSHAKADAGTCGAGCCELLTSYEAVSAALAADDLAAAKDAAHDLAHYGECDGNEEFATLVTKISKANDIKAARTAFKAVSAAVIPLAAEAGDHYIMTCPMAGADWIQTSKNVANPYFGSEMLGCGSVKKTVSPNT